jgi:hypothetical protein
MGGAPDPIATPIKGDKRFKHEDWEQHFLFDYIKQSYLIAADWMHDAVGSVEGLDDATKRKVNFFTGNTSTRWHRRISRSPIRKSSARRSPPAARTSSRVSTTSSPTSSAATASSRSR